MTNIDNTTVTFSAQHYEDFLNIQHALCRLSDFYEEIDIDFPATDLTPALRTLGCRLSAIFEQAVTKQAE